MALLNNLWNSIGNLFTGKKSNNNTTNNNTSASKPASRAATTDNKGDRPKPSYEGLAPDFNTTDKSGNKNVNVAAHYTGKAPTGPSNAGTINGENAATYFVNHPPKNTTNTTNNTTNNTNNTPTTQDYGGDYGKLGDELSIGQSIRRSWGDALGMAEDQKKYAEDESNKLINNINTLSSNFKDIDLKDYKTNLDNALSDYKKYMDKYTGENAYRTSLSMAQQGATEQANNAAAVAQGAARSAGMSKAAAAALGMGNAVNAYNQGLNAQQNQAMNSLGASMNAAGNVLSTDATKAANMLSGATNAYNNQINTQGTAFTNNQNAYQAAINNFLNYASNAFQNEGIFSKLWSDLSNGKIGGDENTGNNNNTNTTPPASNLDTSQEAYGNWVQTNTWGRYGPPSYDNWAKNTKAGRKWNPNTSQWEI